MEDAIPNRVTSDFAADLNNINASPPESRANAFSPVLEKILSLPPDRQINNLIAYIASPLSGDISVDGVAAPTEPLSITSLRSILSTFTTKLAQIPSNETKIEVANATLSLLRPRILSFEEQDTALKLLLADAYQAEEEFTNAAKALSQITLDSTQRTVTDRDRAEIWVRIARCYLEEDDATSANTYINRAKNVMHNVQDKNTQLNFSMSRARILDSQRQFLDASKAYHTLSSEAIIHEDDRLQSLSAAIVCAVLAPAGPQRAQMLSRLYKDDRASQTEEYSILEKIFLDRVLTPEEVKAFAGKLQPHQVAVGSDGTTVLDKAILEHNLLGASKLYQNINVGSLGALLGVDSERAEQYAAQMIQQGRLAGHIDQVDGIIFFEGEGSGESLKPGSQLSARSGQTELRRWDAAVRGVAEDVEKITTLIQSQFPELFSATLL